MRRARAAELPFRIRGFKGLLQNHKEYCMGAGPGRCVDSRSHGVVILTPCGRGAVARPPRVPPQWSAAFFAGEVIRLSYPLLKLAAVALGIGLMSAASAISLGDMEVRSGLGQTFSATVHYVTPHADDVHALCIRASTDVAATSGTSLPLTSGVPFLPDPRFEVEPGHGGGTISIRTSRVVNEPLMRLNLVINCGASAVLSREFTVMLDPPQAEAPLAAPRSSLQLSPGIKGLPAAPASATAPPAPASATPPPAPASAAAPAASANAAATASPQSPVRRPPRAAATPAGPAATSRAATALPYEPGVTPPPGRGATARLRPPPEAPGRSQIPLIAVACGRRLAGQSGAAQQRHADHAREHRYRRRSAKRFARNGIGASPRIRWRRPNA